MDIQEARNILAMKGSPEVTAMAQYFLEGFNSAVKLCAEIANSRRDKDFNASKFKASISKHDWVIQFHNGSALAASEISEQILQLSEGDTTGEGK